MGVHAAQFGAARLDKMSGVGLRSKTPVVKGPPGHSVHLEGTRCSGVGERTRTSTPY